ncbi:Aryl-phospho-beta-D-glucosidase BglC, GH1 family [Kibdelosporangium aridum]|uniref:Aryl-phospho-beta-D-glucosidase BglC, GH1 family n=1 Tax=Kibdelosporangium aridum TaxID=2030 RepID=A0A1Y5XS72_KIBAR|nr:Aryl-phospho-beta-D-glucosidase BglC, GH1 family [Kibdelosporangium aridum]
MTIVRIVQVLVATLLAGLVVVPSGRAAQLDWVGPTWVGPLSTQGRYIVDAQGKRFKLKSGNWHGASGTWNGSGDINDPANHHAGEKADQIPLGLTRAKLDTIIDGFVELGLNSIRLPFANQMIHDQTPVTSPVDANLKGKTPLQIYDAVVQRLTERGFAVILNNHTTTSRWCCGVDGNERWNTSQTAQQWEEDWLFMARRYASNKRVVGADLYNEVRRTVWDDPNWGWGNQHDWQRASQIVGDRILTEANPDLLIIVEGINWTGIPVDGFPHGRPTLEPARTLSHTLVDSGKLVYSAHFYGYTGPNHTGATGTGETSDPRYQDLSPEQLREVLYRQAFYVAAETGNHFTAPVWISEFGVGGRGNTDPKSRAWFERFVDYLVETDADFAYWPLVGFHTNKQGNGWGLLHWDAAGQRIGLYDGDDWRAGAWSRLVNAPAKAAQPSKRWSMLTLDHADFQQSRTVRAQPDWDSGARKGVCPDGQRLTGLSHTGNRGLCVESSRATGYQAVRNESYVDTDWASGYTKLQCPTDHYVVGYSVRGAALSSVLCGRSPQALGKTSRTLWFDRHDNRAPGGGEFAHGHYKGQCAADEYIAGVAYTGRIGSSRTPDALLCRRIVTS